VLSARLKTLMLTSRAAGATPAPGGVAAARPTAIEATSVPWKQLSSMLGQLAPEPAAVDWEAPERLAIR
jgi:hypothetical protein